MKLFNCFVVELVRRNKGFVKKVLSKKNGAELTEIESIGTVNGWYPGWYNITRPCIFLIEQTRVVLKFVLNYLTSLLLSCHCSLPVTCVYYDGTSWNWGYSAQYWFHCFHDWKSNGKCEDFEFRTFHESFHDYDC